MLKFVEDGAEAKSFLNFQGGMSNESYFNSSVDNSVILTVAYSLLQYKLKMPMKADILLNGSSFHVLLLL